MRRPHSLLALFLVFAALLLTLSGCESEPSLNVLLVTIDTTRADHLEIYGGPAGTPNLRALAEEGVVFEQAFSPVPITLPAHSSLMTGKVPFTHGVRDNGLFVLGEGQTSLAEIVKEAGYRTAAAIGSFPLTQQFGISQGFDFFDDHLNAPFEDVFGDRIIPKRRLYFDERPAGQVNEALLPWLEENGDHPFFLWAHYFDPHFPHQPPPPYDQLYAHDLYAGEIAYSDESLGILIDTLKRLGVYDRTVIVVTSDHGESRGEHNEATHSLLAYNSTLHIPLVIKPPTGVPVGQRVASRVGLIDVFPTLLDWLDLSVPDGIQGRTLAPALADGGASLDDRVLYAETLSPRLNHDWGELRALYMDQHKYIHGPRPELYGLSTDPRELRDLVAEDPEEAERLKGLLASYLERHAVEALDSSVAIDEATAQRLMALGYLQPSGVKVGAITEELHEEGDPPQDRAVTIGMYSQAKQFLFEGRWLDARESFERLLRLDPDNGHYTELLALAESRLGRLDRARELLESIPHDLPVPPREKVLESIGNLLLAGGDLQGALEHYRDSQALARTATGQHRIAELYLALGDSAQYERHLEAALGEDEAFAPARLALAVVRAQEGDVEAARAQFTQALESHPFFPRGHYNYGVFLWTQEDAEQAESHLRRAVTLEPNYHQARGALVEVLVGLDREDDALDEYLELATRAPQSPYTEQAAQLLEINL